MNNLLHFNEMLTPKIITFVYWLLLLGIAIAGLGYIFTGYGNFFIKLITGLAIIAGGGIAARVYCEIMIVIFKIEENTRTNS